MFLASRNMFLCKLIIIPAASNLYIEELYISPTFLQIFTVFKSEQIYLHKRYKTWLLKRQIGIWMWEEASDR